jgi:hypothetical protein
MEASALVQCLICCHIWAALYDDELEEVEILECPCCGFKDTEVLSRGKKVD